jgi:hypothetical protein
VPSLTAHNWYPGSTNSSQIDHPPADVAEVLGEAPVRARRRHVCPVETLQQPAAFVLPGAVDQRALVVVREPSGDLTVPELLEERRGHDRRVRRGDQLLPLLPPGRARDRGRQPADDPAQQIDGLALLIDPAPPRGDRAGRRESGTTDRRDHGAGPGDQDQAAQCGVKLVDARCPGPAEDLECRLEGHGWFAPYAAMVASSTAGIRAPNG